MSSSPACGQSPGSLNARDEVLRVAYEELRAVASAYLRKERPGHTLQTTALVHEAYVRLLRTSESAWTSRAVFCAAAATAMRRVLVDHARSRSRKKRGDRDAGRVNLDTAYLLAPEGPLDLVAVDQALTEFEAYEPRASRIVELRFFCGLTEDETADALGFSRRTVSKDWRFARAWLRERLERDGIGE